MLARLLALLVLVASSLVGARATAGEVLAHERYELDNGLDVVLHVDRSLPLVAVDLSYHVGWMHDGELAGVAHLVEHLMFRGTRDVGDGELKSLLHDAGARGTNAETHYDRTSYRTVVPVEQLPLALWLESNRMTYLMATISDGKVDQEIGTTIDEWEHRVASEPDGETFLALRDSLFPPGHPFHFVRPADIRRLQRDHVRDFVQRHHGPANATLVLAGDLPADVREQVEDCFGDRRGGEHPAVLDVTVAPPSKEQRLLRVSELATTSMVLMAWPTPGLYEPGDAEADVLAFTLDAGRLLQMLEAQAPRVFLHVHVHQESRNGQSLFTITARGTSSGQPLRMQAALDAVLDELRTRPLSPGDVRRARRRLTITTLRGLQRMEHRADRMQAYISAGKPPDWLEEDLARYDAVDEIGVGSFVRSHLTPERRVLVLAYPAEDSE